MGDETTAEAIDTLRLFNEKADKLESLAFTKTLLTEPPTFHLEIDSRVGGGAWRAGPRGESIDAFVLTFRYFVQDNEPTSLRKMASLYDRMRDAALIPGALAEEFHTLRGHVNRHLDSDTPINYNERRLTHRDIYEVFLWGGLAHSDKKAIYDEWKNYPLPMLFLAAEHHFVVSMCEILAVIFGVRELNRRALAEMESNAGTA